MTSGSLLRCFLLNVSNGSSGRGMTSNTTSVATLIAAEACINTAPLMHVPDLPSISQRREIGMHASSCACTVSVGSMTAYEEITDKKARQCDGTHDSRNYPNRTSLQNPWERPHARPDPIVERQYAHLDRPTTILLERNCRA